MSNALLRCFVPCGPAGYYRVNYDLFNWLRLLRAFHDDPDAELPSEGSRAMLLDDALSLASSGLLEYPVALRLVEAMLVRERHPAPWIVASRHLDRLAKYFRGPSSEHEIAFDVSDASTPEKRVLGTLRTANPAGKPKTEKNMITNI